MSRCLGWVVGVVAVLAWCGPAGATVTATGSLKVTSTSTTSVSFSVSVDTRCTEATEACGFFAELDQLDGTGACPAERPLNNWNLWNGEVQEVGPWSGGSTETPQGWKPTGGAPPSRLCLYVYVNQAYYLVDGTTIQQPPPGSPPSTPPGTRPPGGSDPNGPAPTTRCSSFKYQQSAQRALKRDRRLAATLDPDGDGVACETLPKQLLRVATLSTSASATRTRAALRARYGARFTRRTAYRATCSRLSRTRVRCRVTWRHGGPYTGYVDVVGVIRNNKQTVLVHVHVARGTVGPRPPRPNRDPTGGSGCDPSYPTVCIRPGKPDLDCDDIPYTDFPVRGDDPHHFDDNRDGVGCESAVAV